LLFPGGQPDISMGAQTVRGPNMTTLLPRGIVGVALLLALAAIGAGSSNGPDVDRLVRQLGSVNFKEREAAASALTKLGKPALAALQTAAKDSADEEVRSRAAKLVLAIRDALIRPIDLAPYANQKLGERFHNYRDGNDLAALPTGPQTFAGVKFAVGPGVVQLGAGKPAKVEGIKVGLKAERLQFLHACGHNDGPLNTPIGKYVVRYDDKTTAEIEVVYGKDVVDWWVQPGVADPTVGKVAWAGQNKLSPVKLFLTTWANPHPAKRIVALDFAATRNAPFCVAITAEE
jgi:hypothetical protein